MKSSTSIFIIIVFLVLVAGAVFFFMNGSKNPLTTPGTEGGNTEDVQIANFAFSPSQIIISEGDTVRWTNMDSATHRLLSDSAVVIDSPPLSKGATYSHTFNVLGTYPYHCSTHPTMKGTVIVQ